MKFEEGRGSSEPDAARGPSFIFVGTGRSGSTWFFEVLREHPDIFVPPNKGTFFFTRMYDFGTEWYEGFFPRERHGKMVGEVCEDYLCRPEALARIKAYNPNVRLVCCLRNPYERAFSAWRFFGRNGAELTTMAKQAVARPELFYMGHYATQLQVVRNLFPEEQVQIFLYDELRSDPQGVVRRLYKFTGVNPEFVPPSLHLTINANGMPRSKWLARLVHDVHMHSWGRSRAVSNIIGAIKHVRFIRWFVQGVLYKRQRPIDDWANHLAEFPHEVVSRYEQEISGLEKMLGRDLEHWHLPSMRTPKADAQKLGSGRVDRVA